MTMVKVDYHKIDFEKLIEMRDEIDAVIKEKRDEVRQQFKKEMFEKAQALGFDPADLFATSSKRRGPKTGGTVAPKYRNSDDHTQTWTGRGREPAWIKGKNRDKYLIK